MSTTHRKGKLATLAALLAGALALTACGGGGDSAPASTPAEESAAAENGDAAPAGDIDTDAITPINLSLGHAYAVDSLQHRAAEQLAALLSEMSDGKITLDVFPSAQLGSWEEMQEGLEIGSVDIVIESIGSLERYTDLAAIEGLPFLYTSEEHFLEVWQSDLAGEILGAIRDDSGFLLLGQLYRGPRVLNSIRPVDELSDLAGLKLRVPNQQTYIDTWVALGASPTPMALNEVFSAMEQGTVEGQENPLDVVRFSSFYEVAPYVTETNHLYGAFHFQLWGDTFDSWQPEVQQILLEAIDIVSSTYEENSIAETADHRVFLEEEGVEFFPIVQAEWQAKVADLINQANPTVQEWANEIMEMGN
jgi:tripartite ATP-independent transporter DctP family solute receptor